MPAVNAAATLTSNLDYAIHYSSLGWEVFPAHTIKDGACSCRKSNCTSPGKHPMTQNGLKDATTNRSKILKWWNTNSDANIAIRTGIKSGLAVLDIDAKSNGFASLEALENTFEPLPETLTAITGGKGNHICFTHTGDHIKTRSNIFEGIDFRGDGGYIIAPPSLHISGNAYQWVDLNKRLACAPQWLTELINNPTKNANTASDVIIPKGSRNSTLMSLAGKKWSEGITKPSLRTYLLEENHLKCLPPLAHDEVLGIVGRVSAYKPGQKKFLYSWREQFRDSDLPGNCKLVLFVLAEHMDAYGKSCYPTQTQIAKGTSLSRKTVIESIKKCVNSGWITIYKHSSSEQEFWNNGYIARLPDV